MAFVCENCGKATVHGRQSTHHRGVAGKRWKKRAPVTLRTFKPNLQMFHGMKLCTNCIKRIKKDTKAEGYTLPQIASN